MERNSAEKVAGTRERPGGKDGEGDRCFGFVGSPRCFWEKGVLKVATSGRASVGPRTQTRLEPGLPRPRRVCFDCRRPRRRGLVFPGRPKRKKRQVSINLAFPFGVPRGGFEPPRAQGPLRPERSASTSSTTSANNRAKFKAARSKKQAKNQRARVNPSSGTSVIRAGSRRPAVAQVCTNVQKGW